MKNLFFLIQLLTFSEWTITHNLTDPERSSYAEQALSSELEEVDSRSGGWSKWSDWSPCSRSCDGGVSRQIRSCKTSSCRGEHVRYKICNMQVLAAAVLAIAQAGLVSVVAPSTRILQGPSSRTTVVGPDGSAISAVAPGGQIVTDESVGVVAQTAPVVAAAPALIRSAPVVAAASPLLASGVVASGLAGTVVSGPSGVVATSRLAAPGLVAPGLLANGLVAPGLVSPWAGGLVL